MKESVFRASNGSRCHGRNRAGSPCARRAVKDGYCTVHHPTEGQDMQALGRRGGSMRPNTKLRAAAADNLRELARQTLERALRGEDVDPQQLRAAQSLFSYRSAAPPEHDPTRGEYTGELMPDGSRPVSLGDVLAFAMSANESTRAVAEAAIAQAQAAAPPTP
jgi:hypothetical protein